MALFGMNYRQVNRLFTFVCFAVPPVLGSVVSIVWHGGAIWCVFEAASRRRKFSTDSYMVGIAVLMYIYVSANLISFFLNDQNLHEIINYTSLATFLFFPFSYSIWSISDKGTIARASILASMWASYGALAFAALQYHLWDMRAEGGSGNALVFATVTCLAGTVALAGALSLEKRLGPYLVGAYMASVMALVYSQSRIVWISLLVVTCIVLWSYRTAISQMISRRAIALMAASALAVLVASFSIVWTRVESLLRDWHALAATGDYDTSLGLRVAVWEIGASLFRESPLFGHGMHSVRSLIAGNFENDYGLSVGFTHFHNGVLTLLVESGIVGTLSIIAVFAIAATNAVRTLRRNRDDTERFGAVLLLIVVATYTISGTSSILIGHDILDTMLMIFLIVGTYLASGTSMLTTRDSR